MPNLLSPIIVEDSKELRDLTLEAEGYKDLAEAGATTATTQAGIATDKAGIATTQAGLAQSYGAGAESARDEAVAIVYGGDYSVTPAAGNVPIARPDGTLESGWIAGEYSAMLVGHINYATDLANQSSKAVNGGEISVAAGSAARPSISLGTNKSTGLFFPADDEIAFTINGVEVLRIDATGIVP